MAFRRTMRLNRVLDRFLGGTNLEVFKFGLYIMFPIGWMWYFGTHLETKFAVPDFWPKPEETHRIPFERDEIASELQRLKERRLRIRDKRLQKEVEMQQASASPDESGETVQQQQQNNTTTDHS